ncbi:MAG: hypothetical protein ACOY93_06440 [Bacillota bacterium]
MARRRSLLSDETKMFLARLQGAGDRAQPGDYGLLTSREAGSMVKYAIMAAEQALAGQAPNVTAPDATAPTVTMPGATPNPTVVATGPNISTTPQAAGQPGVAPFPTQRS